jgi:hypothetical protein
VLPMLLEAVAWASDRTENTAGTLPPAWARA